MALLAVTLRLLFLIGAACLCNTGCLLFWLQIKSLVENTTAERHKETGEMEKKMSVNPVVQEKVGKLKGEEDGSVPSCFLMSGARYKADKEVSRERKG